MSELVSIAIEGAQTSPWIPAIKRSGALKRDALNVDLDHIYKTDAFVLDESDWVYIQAVLYAEQIHPYTIDQIDALDGIEGRDAARWTMEGPTYTRPGEPENCTLTMEIAYSLTASPGTDWRQFNPGDKLKLRSCKLRLTIHRPSTDFDFRVYRFAIRATRIAPTQVDHPTGRFFTRG